MTIALDADEGVGREDIVGGRFGFAACERQAETQHQASARGSTGPEKAAPGESVHRSQFTSTGSPRRLLIDYHGYLPLSSPQPA